MKNMKVTTYSGKTADRSACRYIGDYFFLIGDPLVKDSGDCFLLQSNRKTKPSYYRINSNKITWSYTHNAYVIIEDYNLIKGYVGKNEMGYFEPNKYKNVFVRNISPLYSQSASKSSTTICLDEETAIKMGAFLSKMDGFWYVDSEISTFNQKAVDCTSFYYGKVQYKDFETVYNLADTDASDEIEYYLSKLDIKPSKFANNLQKLLGGWSFGGEFETSMGRIQDKDLYSHGLVPIRDGSIPNHEYVSIPFRTAKDNQIFLNALDLLQETCHTDSMCSLHYHFGDKYLKKSEKDQKLFLVSLYMLYFRLQNEIWEILPGYKKSNDYFKNKKDFKDHCQNLHSLSLGNNNIYSDNKLQEGELDKAVGKIFQFLNEGYAPNEDYNFKSKRFIKEGANKWDIKSRYYNLNLFNAIFSKSGTVEFRAHSGTINKTKSINWLLICTAILRYAEEYPDIIINGKEKITLYDVLNQFKTNFGKEDLNPEFSHFVSNYLCEYVDSRKNTFTKNFYKNSIFGTEFTQDKTFDFKVEKKNIHGW